MKSKEVKRKEAIARNEKNWQKYTNEGINKGLKDGALAAFVDHKIGIPKEKKRS